ncbi:Spy/CpxP family protein refolding chaperone [Ramlibacter algicola]|uniref:Spy/CpxP family protein refolding chaperone n=1 Tax=Ramlibacter algicola TaxID=2795217 RepID=A0A934PXW3_9BURK|nr:Spy/CpxP family protein refolding chaperone [Ramlibacter algicola]MBK0391378.1 Spy/CpxP family protein refolding chaperone [Ramlibacter algicola]
MHFPLRKHFVTLALLAGVGLASAQAQQPAPQAAQAGPAASAPKAHKFDPAKRAERVNKRLADLHAKLQLSQGQEYAWSQFVAAMQPPANAPQRPDRAAFKAMTTPERIDQMRAMRDRRNAEMDQRAEATKTLYAQLTPEQKKTFDAESSRMFQRGHRGMHGHHGRS